MWIVKMAWMNLWRNRSRTFITMTAIFFAVVLSTIAESLKRGVFENLVKNVVSFYTGYIQIHKKGYYDEPILDNSFASTLAIKRKILNEKRVAYLSPRLESFALASSPEMSKGCMVCGILPESENGITSLRNKLVKGSYLDSNDKSVMIAEGLAQRIKLTVNDTIVLIGQGYHGTTAAGKYKVKGVLKFGSPQLNDRILYCCLSTAQDLFSAGSMITSYVLSVKHQENVNEIATSINKSLGNDYEVMSWQELLPDIRQHIATDSNNMKIVQGVLYLLICFGIFGTILMMLLERKFEMGMLVAIGMKKSKLMFLLVVESVLTVSIGCIGGIATSVPLVYYLNHHPISIGGETAMAYERFGFEAIFPTSVNSSIFIYQAVIVLAIGLVLSLYPVLKVWRLEPVVAMKK